MINIDSAGFGWMVVNGQTYRRDIKIIDNIVIPNWRRQSGHRVQIEDVADMLPGVPEFIVLGTGKFGLMRVSQQLRLYLKNAGISLLDEKNTLAIDTFNHLSAKGVSVAAGFHLTC